MPTSEIIHQLEALAASDVLEQGKAVSCSEAAALLASIREEVLADGVPADTIVHRVKSLLAGQDQEAHYEYTGDLAAAEENPPLPPGLLNEGISDREI